MNSEENEWTPIIWIVCSLASSVKWSSTVLNNYTCITDYIKLTVSSSSTSFAMKYHQAAFVTYFT